MSSWGCALIGMVAMTSSEVSLIAGFWNHKWKAIATEPDCSLPHSQELSICPYPEPDQSSQSSCN
jgi:hypothetical protein